MEEYLVNEVLQVRESSSPHMRHRSINNITSSHPETGETPILRIRVFGGVEVMRGDALVASDQFHRQKVKALLVMLALNCGKELSCDTLGRLLWPDGSTEKNRRNFYSTWSLMRKALCLPSGECPYLIRQQGSCKLDGRLVVSDVQVLEGLCNTLLFDKPPASEALQVYARLRGIYRGELLPSEKENSAIIRQRREWNDKVVDALVATAKSMHRQQHYRTSLWFAQAASSLDSFREDVCEVLMRVQIDIGQRTGALATYHACRRHLADELGIDPSRKTVALFEEILNEEPHVIERT